MRRDRVAEYLVSLVAPPERAASAVGDLIGAAAEATDVLQQGAGGVAVGGRLC